jgi:hypothetical protein
MRRDATTFLGSLLALLTLGAGCDIDAYCFSECEDGVGGAPTGGSGGSTTDGGGGTGAGFTTVGGGGTGGIIDCGDTQMSLENCGQCGKKCEPAGAIPVCVDGECHIQACLTGQYDIDGVAENGCEYACPIPVPGPELCDGVDNDCDSLLDSDDPDLLEPTTLCNTSANTPCETTQIVCNGQTGWSCVYPAGVETVQGIIRTTESLCDGIDGNCDGSVDEWFTTLGDTCADLALGQCQDLGVLVCDAANPLQVTCDLSAPPAPGVAEAEACDGIDNDCDGLVDNALPVTAFDMVAIPGGGGVTVDRFEASRPDSSAIVPGILENVSCSKPSVVPWTGAGYDEASAACAARGTGFRLCTLSELTAACRGGANTLYPYGAAYDAMACNGVDDNVTGAHTTGAKASCVTSPQGIFDMSGNVAEWTSTQTNVAAPPDRIFALSGGSYLSPEVGLACSIDLVPRAVESTLLPNIGFRCCKDP